MGARALMVLEPPAPAGGGVADGAAGAGKRQPGSPYVATPAPQTAGPLPHQALIGLVLLEAVALVAMRRGFRHHHGG